MQVMEAKTEIITRLLPKTGQAIVYQSGDDGDYQAGWWSGRSVANNKERFVQKTVEDDIVVLDRATGLVWAADGHGAGCKNGSSASWSNAILYAENLIFANLPDWRLPNVRELASIIDNGNNLPCVKEPPFINTYSTSYWTSTTRKDLTTFAWHINFDIGIIYIKEKALGDYKVRCVRNGL